ncbi:MAG: hypothetical protein U1E61_23170 [Bradyrhizobium sp.]
MQNIYNSTAFSMDDACTTVFSIKKCGKSAFILLVNEPKALAAKDDALLDLSAGLKRHMHNANLALGIEDDRDGIQLRSWRMEISKVERG